MHTGGGARAEALTPPAGGTTWPRRPNTGCKPLRNPFFLGVNFGCTWTHLPPFVPLCSAQVENLHRTVPKRPCPVSCRWEDLLLTAMYKAFWFSTDAGDYWSVVDDDCYEVVELADRFLQYMRFGRGRAESTTRKYAEAIALYHNFCSRDQLAGLTPIWPLSKCGCELRHRRATRTRQGGYGPALDTRQSAATTTST